MGPKAGDERLRAYDMSKLPNAADMLALFKPNVQVRDGKHLHDPGVLGL